MREQMLYQGVDGFIEVIPSSVEGELCLKKVKPLKQSGFMFTLYIIGCILTGGIFYVICEIWPQIFEKIVFKNAKSPFTATHVHAIDANGNSFYEKIYFYDNQPKLLQKIPFFVNRYMKYIYDERRTSFQALEFELEGQKVKSIATSQPLRKEDIPEFLKYYGHSFIDIVIPGYHKFFATELLRPINFLLYFGLIVWIFEQRISFFSVTLASTLIIILILCFFVRTTKQKLRNECLHDQIIEVERSGMREKVSSKDLVPGDIIYINQNISVPFDCIVLDGQLLVNEANITGRFEFKSFIILVLIYFFKLGESIPVNKTPLSAQSNEEFKFSTQNAHILFEGSSIIQLEDGIVKLMVTRTGYSSYKGQIIRSLQHQKPIDKRIYYQGIKFVLFILFLVYIAFFATLYKLLEIKMSTKDIVYRFFDVIIYAAPPGTPLLINAVIFFSLIRLRQKNIYGSDTSKPIQAGRVKNKYIFIQKKTICFDKTGTLTQSTVDILGYQLSQQDDSEQILKEGDKHSILYKLLSSCHQSTISQNGEMTGDPIDVEMVKFSGWKIGYDNIRKQNYSELNNNNTHNKLYTIYVNEFHSEFQSMSVICQEEIQQNVQKSYLFIKGSPEIVLSKCTSNNNEQQLLKNRFENLAGQGLRVLGVGYKPINQQELSDFIQKERSEQEQNIEFLGFVIFKNNLKSDSSHVIKQLIDADIKIKIISGDNAITTLKIAQEANIVSEEQDTILVDCINRQFNQLTLTRYSSTSKGNQQQQNQIIDLYKQEQVEILIRYCEQAINNSLSICVTGNTLQLIEEFIKKHEQNYLSTEFDSLKESIQSQNVSQNIRKLQSLLVLSSQIFARNSPQQKANVVKIIKENNEIVGMVGDGTNDSPAIREADIGISFSDADGQFSAPYISKNPSLDCVIKIILEGRVSIGVSIDIFIGYIQISIIRLIGLQALSYFYSGFNDLQLTWQSYVSGFVVVYFFKGLTRPVQKIKKCFINDNFYSLQYIISSIFGFIVQSSSIIVGLAVLKNSKVYQEVTGFDQDNKFIFECQPNTIVFMFTLIHYFYVHLCNNIGTPVKKPWYNNYVTVLLMMIQFIYGCLITLTPKVYVKGLKLVDLDDIQLRISLFFIFNGFGLLQLILEKTLIQTFVLRYHEKYSKKQSQQKYINLINSLKKDAKTIHNT